MVSIDSLAVPMSFPAAKSHFTYLWLIVAFLRVGRAHDVSNNSDLGGLRIPTHGSLFPTITERPTSFVTPTNIRLRRAPAGEETSFCVTPPEPANGQYKLDFCDNGARRCEAIKGTAVKPGGRLVYRCNAGFRLTGSTDVYCSARGEWSAIPECLEVRCDSLNSESTSVTCSRFGKWVNCDSPVPPQTRAEVACRHGYKKDTDFVTTRRSVVNCDTTGKWVPQPIKCVPVCGRTITHQQPLVYGGSPAKIGDFPWHASLFVEKRSLKGNKKRFICGGTIIKTNLVLTAAHCVYDEVTKTTLDPGKLFVITGNIFRDYDSPLHNQAIVRNASVKNVYVNCNYYGLIGNYVSDIALLELENPFEFSSILLPACLDDSGYSEQSLEPGVFGKVAGFGRTEEGTTSAILQTLSLPYISYSQCKASDDADRNEAFISSDKFCAGYNNGSAVCEGDSGGGLVFKKGDLWYVMGIVSVGLGVDLDNGEKTCDKFSYSLYTKVSAYMTWIQDVLFYLERNLQYPSCGSDSRNTTPTTAPVATTTDSAVPFCVAPPQPANGEWRLDSDWCESQTDCSISEGTALEVGSQLRYTCAPNFIADGLREVYCEPNGKLTTIPTCYDAACKLTNGSSGICTLLKNCDSVVEAMKTGGTPDTVCGSPGSEPIIVCCPIPPEVPEIPEGDGRGAIAKKKCIEYSKNASPSTCPSPDYDQPNASPSGRRWPDKMEFPHLAALGFPVSWDANSFSWDCSGALISENFVLTSAACADTTPSGNATMVRVGILDGSLYEERRIAERFKHPEYKPPSEYHDIGLIRLETSISLDDWIRPACLHTASSVASRVAITTKWGYTDKEKDEGSTSLFKVTLPVVDLPICKTRWAPVINATPPPKRITGSAVLRPSQQEKKLAKGIVEDWMICAGATGKSTCQGDPGGPLVIHRVGKKQELCMYDVIGVMSQTKSCSARIPALYTRVYNYIPWIEPIVWGQ